MYIDHSKWVKTILPLLLNPIYPLCPTTWKFKIIRSAKMDGEFYLISPFTVAFDPSRSPHFRIVCFKKESTRSNYYFEVNVCPNVSLGIFSNGVVIGFPWTHLFRYQWGTMMLMALPFIYRVHKVSWQIGCLWQMGRHVLLCQMTWIGICLSWTR